ncbi:unnamed protein product [Haemonchus placei]|uniref:NR LBD domain-containing protein n=1 Tax=Haemonchus placei TaxID=6290 RepID=A0A0N4WJ58_HAEPC|nr:unnamed protein product [Haemonchus placei]
MLTINPMMQSLQPTGYQDCVPSTSLKYATPTPGVAGDGKYDKLTAEDLQLVQELFRANEPLKAPLDFQFKDELTLMDIVKIIEAALKRIVCMARDLTAFQALDIEDKKNIMKGSCSELLILRGVMAFDPTKNTWNHNFSTGFKGMEVKLDLLKLVTESQHYEEHKKFLTEFHQQIRANECVMLLLMAIVIFRPDRHNLRDTHRIRDIQYMYYGVLRRVVECEYTGGEAVQIYEALVRKLEELKHLKEGLVEAFYGFDSRQLDPLIKELFDMI